MKPIYKTISILALISAFSTASAYWPTSLEENLVIAADPELHESYPKALPYPDGQTLVVLLAEGTGTCYQIIDRYGEFVYSELESVAPGLEESYFGQPKLISDGEGGAFIVWKPSGICPNLVIYAQRLDSLGNRMWGDDAVEIYPEYDTDYDICIDGEGGFYFSIGWDISYTTYVWIQRIDGDGNLLWGDQGIMVSTNPNHAGRYPVVTYDGNGGAFVVWEDWRPPYNMWGALFAQHFSENGNQLWSQDLFICQHVWEHIVISDGLGGFILQANPGASDYNTHWRIDASGNILWQRERLSWYYWAPMIAGETGFFYIAFEYDEGLWGQRVDMNGNNYWPTWGSGQPGAPMETSLLDQTGSLAVSYRYPYFYGISCARRPSISIDTDKYLLAQKMDSLGNVCYGDTGVILSLWEDNYYNMLYLSPVINDSFEVTVVYENRVDTINSPDVYANHCLSDGTLGGYLPSIESVIVRVDTGTVILTWPFMADSAKYNIYKSSEPYNFPEEPDTTVNDTSYIDPEGLNQDNFFYKITWELQ